MNWPLFSMMWSMTATVLIGVLMITSLVIGFDDIPEIIGVCIAGAIVAFPISFVLTKRVSQIKE